MTSTFATIGRKYLGVICLFVITVILIAGLWPFDFNPVNKVEWLQNTNGIRFYGQGMIVSRQPLNFGIDHVGTDSISIEMPVLPHKKSTNTVASIVTLYDHEREVFMAGQWQSELIIRIPDNKVKRKKRYREIGVDNAFQNNVKHLLTITSSKETTRIYMDGNLIKSVPHFPLITEGQRPSGQLVLGNSPDGRHSWNGTFYGLALYGPSLNKEEVLGHYHEWQNTGHPSGSGRTIALYLFDNHDSHQIQDYSASENNLLIPATFQPLRRTILEMPEDHFFFSCSNLKDIVINIVGFIPLGFFLSAWLRQAKNFPASRSYGISLFIGFCLSLAIELSQVYLPTRDSSLMDVISNTFGTAAGISFFKGVLPLFY